jgi:hypothetical protein
MDSALRELVAAWPQLPAEARKEMMMVVRRHRDSFRGDE